MSDQHGTPAEGTSCRCCWDDISMENYVEYKASSDSAWQPSGYCEMCVEQLLKTQWTSYKGSLEKTNCKAEQRRLLSRGPPVNLRDPEALPTPDDKEVHSLWYGSVGELRSAKLEGSLEGEERVRYWEEQKLFYIHDEKDEEEVVQEK